ncbi:protein of unknown function [Acidithiobacillus ferrivorans]|uniref:Uncharacterized protein n=1 Tax=Acidithiobacillus ferrivorans TaxID=160808 RepID=A0ABY1MRW9_9PROT|nr:protein of unknown function [Acidithiobacillus ferrivorans]
MGGGQHVKILTALILDERLLQFSLALDDIDEIVHNPSLTAHDQVEVAQPYVEVDNDGAMAAQGEAAGKGGTGGGFADPTLSGSDDNDFGHGSFLQDL